MLLVPGDPTINEHLGDALWKAGRKMDARFQWNHALTFGRRRHRQGGDGAEAEKRADADNGADGANAAIKRAPPRSICSSCRRQARRRLSSLAEPGGVRRSGRPADCGRRRTSFRWSVEGPFAAGLEGEGDNLVLRAARALAAASGRAGRGQAHAHQESAGGVRHRRRQRRCGGGAARVCRRSGSSNMDEAALRDIARQPGLRRSGLRAKSSRACMEGRGEILTPVTSLPRLPLLLVNPGVAVPTEDVFAALQTRSGVEHETAAGPFPRHGRSAALSGMPPTTTWKRRRRRCSR